MGPSDWLAAASDGSAAMNDWPHDELAQLSGETVEAARRSNEVIDAQNAYACRRRSAPDL